MGGGGGGGRFPKERRKMSSPLFSAAKNAFESWSTTSIEDRAKYLKAISDKLAERRDELADIIANEVGMPLPMATVVQAGMPAMIMGSYAQILQDFKFEEKIDNALVVKGQLAWSARSPWNYPLHQVVARSPPHSLPDAPWFSQTLGSRPAGGIHSC